MREHHNLQQLIDEPVLASEAAKGAATATYEHARVTQTATDATVRAAGRVDLLADNARAVLRQTGYPTEFHP